MPGDLLLAASCRVTHRREIIKIRTVHCFIYWQCAQLSSSPEMPRLNKGNAEADIFLNLMRMNALRQGDIDIEMACDDEDICIASASYIHDMRRRRSESASPYAVPHDDVAVHYHLGAIFIRNRFHSMSFVACGPADAQFLQDISDGQHIRCEWPIMTLI